MGLKVSENATQFQILEAGEHLGVCYSIVDAGTREEQYMDNPPKLRKVIYVTWEVPSQEMDDGSGPLATGKKYTASLNENSALYKDLVTWRGKPFSSDELSGFDVSKMVGAPANLHIEHYETQDGKQRAGLKAIFKPDEFKITKTINDPVVFDLDVYCEYVIGTTNEQTVGMSEVFDKIPEWLQEIVKESIEYKSASAKAPAKAESSPTASGGLSELVKDEEEENIPF